MALLLLATKAHSLGDAGKRRDAQGAERQAHNWAYSERRIAMVNTSSVALEVARSL